ncbi:MAG TPA: hypothetical protein VFO16_06190 [Pseudonocardiaceae bacterium]|nr:hypothetical protein [Pseudonocardiaceae bacterium]
MNAGPHPAPRNGLGAAAFALTVLGALLCLVAIVPAVVSFRRVRKGIATNHRSCGSTSWRDRQVR